MRTYSDIKVDDIVDARLKLARYPIAYSEAFCNDEYEYLWAEIQQMRHGIWDIRILQWSRYGEETGVGELSIFSNDQCTDEQSAIPIAEDMLEFGYDLLGIPALKGDVTWTMV